MPTPPFHISTDALNLIAEISSLLERHNITLDQEDLKLCKANRIKTIHSSLAIEGNTLSEEEVKDIVNGKQIVAATKAGQSGPFIDFLMREIRNTLQKNLEDKVPNKSELTILDLLSHNPGLTRSELASQIGLTDNGVKKILGNLKAAGWIERTGSNKSGYWIVKY